MMARREADGTTRRRSRRLPARHYLAALGALAVLAFLAGALLNFVHATLHPGADPYRPAAERAAPAG